MIRVVFDNMWIKNHNGNIYLLLLPLLLLQLLLLLLLLLIIGSGGPNMKPTGQLIPDSLEYSTWKTWVWTIVYPTQKKPDIDHVDPNCMTHLHLLWMSV